eukprot:TRINITY_DN3259_c0_g1_i1.p2 TRINITY_DN3259_c0_g1~~TRINITY_DN3259_c0_g1_i1.p2  ORF type:complete len:255 (-),score=17.07 TRINITY_DN3259_c0_g1_i1:215-979(-)
MLSRNHGRTNFRLNQKPLTRVRRVCRVCSQYQRQPGGGIRTDQPPQEFFRQGSSRNYDFPPQPQRSYGNNLPPTPPPESEPGGGGKKPRSMAWIVAAFIFGIGAGVWFDKDFNYEPQNVASTEIIDRRTPNAEVCMANGYSAMVFDQRIFVSFNPFNVYVSQPEVKPGCVLRRSNYNVLENRQLVNRKEVLVKRCAKQIVQREPDDAPIRRLRDFNRQVFPNDFLGILEDLYLFIFNVYSNGYLCGSTFSSLFS